jgi:asparagine synthase (glutamine-hydrolysing)
MSVFNDHEREKLYSSKLNSLIGAMDGSRPPQQEAWLKPYFNDARTPFLNQMLIADIGVWLPDNLLLKLDKMTMAHGVEARVPYLDSQMVMYSTSLPTHLKLKSLWSREKYILRKAMAHSVPKRILNRRKHGFNVPTCYWLRGYFQELVDEVLSKTSVKERGYFDYEYIHRLLERMQRCRDNNPFSLYYGRQLWTLLSLELWHRIFIDADRKTLGRASRHHLSCE